MTKKFSGLNSRQRLFCIYAVSGMTHIDAYIKAGYSSVNAGPNAAALINHNQSVKAYHQHLLRLKEEESLAILRETVMQPQERQQRLTEIARGNLTDFMDDDGEPQLNSNTRNKGAAREFYHRRRKDQDGNTIITKSIKLLNPIEAIQELNKMDGSYAPSKHMVASRVQIEVAHVNKSHRIEDTTNEDE